MRQFLAALWAEIASPATWIAWAMTSLTVGLSGPFGSFSTVGFWTRLWGWALLIGIGLFGGVTLRCFVRTAFGLTDFLRSTILTATLVAALLAVPLLELGKLLLAGNVRTIPGIFEIMVFCFVISFTMASLRHSVRIGTAAPRRAEPELLAEPSLPRIVQRLDRQLHGRLIALTVRNHYVDVYTTEGRGAVLMRFADAMQEAEGEAGAQIHRSHWVAWWAVKSVEREGGRVFLQVCPELRLPVSKTHVAKLEDGGLSEREAA